MTILRDVCLVDVDVPVPVLDDDRSVRRSARPSRRRGLEERHQLVDVDGRPALDELRERGVEILTMGRSVADDPAFFLAAGAAGVLAGRAAAANRRWRAQRD